MEIQNNANAEENQKKIGAKLMVGQSKFNIPSPEKLEKVLHKATREKKGKFISEIAANKDKMEGKISLLDYDHHLKVIEAARLDPIKSYVNNFTSKPIDTRKVISRSSLRNIGNVFQNQMTRKIQEKEEE